MGLSHRERLGLDGGLKRLHIVSSLLVKNRQRTRKDRLFLWFSAKKCGEFDGLPQYRLSIEVFHILQLHSLHQPLFTSLDWQALDMILFWPAFLEAIGQAENLHLMLKLVLNSWLPMWFFVCRLFSFLSHLETYFNSVLSLLSPQLLNHCLHS